jgi:hypothetical protein
LAISDVVAIAELPKALKDQVAALAGCVAGAATTGEIREMLRTAGFDDVRVTVRPESREFIREWFPGSGAEDYVASATIEATKADPTETAKAKTGATKPETPCCAPGCCGAEESK